MRDYVLEAVGKRKLRELQRCVVAVLLENMALDEPHADLAAYVGRHLAHHVRGALQPEVSLLRDEALLQPLLHHPRAARCSSRRERRCGAAGGGAVDGRELMTMPFR